MYSILNYGRFACIFIHTVQHIRAYETSPYIQEEFDNLHGTYVCTYCILFNFHVGMVGIRGLEAIHESLDRALVQWHTWPSANIKMRKSLKDKICEIYTPAKIKAHTVCSYMHTM